MAMAASQDDESCAGLPINVPQPPLGWLGRYQSTCHRQW